MSHIWQILQFGWAYMRRYWGRFSTGVALALVFGISNATFLWAINTTLVRMSPEPRPAQVESASEEAFYQTWKLRLETASQEFLDEWLPKTGRKPGWQEILGGLLLFPLLAAFRGFSGYFSSYCLAWVSERVVNDLRVDVLRKLSSLSVDYFNRAKMGDLITRVNGDTAALQRCLSLGLSDLIKEPVTIVSVIAALCFIDFQLTMGAMLFFPLIALPILYYGKRVKKAAKAGLQTSVTQSSLLLEMLAGIRVVKAFGLEDHQVDRFRKLSRNLVHHAMRTVRAKEIINPIIEVVSMAGFGVLLIVIMARGVRMEDMISLLAGLVFLYTPTKKLARVHVLLQQTRAGVDRLVQVLNEEPTVKEPAAPRPLKGFHRELAFENVTFCYEAQPVLQGVSFQVPRGMRLGIAGESGSGKSTLINLVFRFYDATAGRICIDGIDLRECLTGDLRNQMALVSQEIVLFDLTVAENIACGKRDATPEEIEEAARRACAHDFILELPEGYNTRIGERGVILSGGQRQRLAIARAFVRNAPILVLDEATASLDSRAEAEVQNAIDRLAENRTVICVAHRLSTLAGMDRIIVLARGRIVEAGTFDELLVQGKVFARMAAAQGIFAPAGRSATLATSPCI